MSDGTVQGKVHFIGETQTFGQKGFRKRLVVLEQDKGRFTNYIPLEFVQDGCDSVDDLHVDEQVEVAFRLSGRKWQKDPQSEVKFFVNAEATGVKKLQQGGGERSGQRAAETTERSESEANWEGDDEVPF